MMKAVRYLFLLGHLAIAHSSFARDIEWTELPEVEREQLSDFQPLWEYLSDQRQTQLRNIADQINRMPPANRTRLLNNLKRFNKMGPEQRNRVDKTQKRLEPLRPEQSDESRPLPGEERQEFTPDNQESGGRDRS